MFLEEVSSANDASQWADFSEVRAEINEIAGHRNAIDGRMVDVAVWCLANDDWYGTGLYKPEQFLAFRCGISFATAKRYVEVAHRVDELPESIAALRAGELSLDQLMPIVRRVPAWADEQVLSLSKKLTVGQIHAVINKYDFERSGLPSEVTDDSDAPGADPSVTPSEPSGDEPSSPETADGEATGAAPTGPAEPPAPKDRCWMGAGDDGRWRLNMESTAELGRVIENAVSEARDRIFRESGNIVSDAEALADVAERSLSLIDDSARAERYRTNIHLNTDGSATDHLGAPLPAPIVEHITCDGLLTPVFHENGVPISVGRGQHIVPARTRKTVLLRDGGCAVPGCGATRHLDVHHIVHWSRGGPSDTWNLVALCTHHHRMHHRGRLGISGDADDGTVVFINERGVNMANDGPRPEPPEGPPPAPSGEFRPPLCERLDMNYVSFIHPARLAPWTRQGRAWAQRQAESRAPS